MTIETLETPRSRSENRKILEQAAMWHAILGDEHVNQKQRQDCNHWCKLSKEHEQAFNNMANAWKKIDRIDQNLRQPAAKVLQQNTSSRRSSFPIIAVLSLSLYWTLFNDGINGLFSDYYTPHGQRQHITLNDGSEIILNTNSAIDIDFSVHERRIKLKYGELYVTVAPDKNRPLVIQTNHATATALGTEFSVKDLDEETNIVVTESKVKVCSQQQQKCVVTHQNEATNVKTEQSIQLQKVHADFLTAWTQGKLVVDNWPLPKLLKELSRYYSGPLLYSDDALNSIQVSGVFNIDEPNQVLSQLKSNLPIHINQAGSFLAVIRKK